MEFLEAIAEGMPAIAQIPFETLRNWMSKNDPAFRPDFFQAFERARAIAVYKNIKKLNAAKDSKAAARMSPSLPRRKHQPRPTSQITTRL